MIDSIDQKRHFYVAISHLDRAYARYGHRHDGDTASPVPGN